MTTLLTTNNPKTSKGAALGHNTAILHLAPSGLASAAVGWRVDACPHSTMGCRAACLNTAGRASIRPKDGSVSSIHAARIERTRLLFADRPAFIQKLQREVEQHIRRSQAVGMTPAIRLNGTSDLEWEALAPSLFEFGVQFYDYTKSVKRMARSLRGTQRGRRHWPGNYALAFSYSGENVAECRDALRAGGVVAAVADPLVLDADLRMMFSPAHIEDGDEHDLVFLRKPGTLLRLKPKGKAVKSKSPFVIRSA